MTNAMQFTGIQYDTTTYTRQCNTIQYSNITMQFDTIQSLKYNNRYNAIQCKTMKASNTKFAMKPQYVIIQYNEMQHNKIQQNAKQYNTINHTMQ